MSANLEQHPLGKLLPPMMGAEFDELCVSIRNYGQREPATLFEDKVLDGWNRIRACRTVGITPRFEQLPEGADPVRFVIDKNLHRRHLSASQRAFIAEDLARLKRGANQHRSRDLSSQAEAAKALDISVKTVKRAAVVMKAAVPEVKEAAKKGEVSLKAAEQIARKPPEEQKQALEEHKKSVKQSRKRKAKHSAKRSESTATNSSQSADEVKARFAAMDDASDDDEEMDFEAGIQPEHLRNAYLGRVSQSIHSATYSGPVDDEVIEAARQVAAAWENLARSMESTNGKV